MNIFKRFIELLPSETVYAHCDIPCGIYDPHIAQMAAHTVVRMTTLLNDSGDDMHKIARLTRVKEKHASQIEEELLTLLVDYFKEDHFKEYPDLKELILKTIKMTGKVKQEVDLKAAQELLENVQLVAEIFWKTKGFESLRVPSGYPTEGEIVTHK